MNACRAPRAVSALCRRLSEVAVGVRNGLSLAVLAGIPLVRWKLLKRIGPRGGTKTSPADGGEGGEVLQRMPARIPPVIIGQFWEGFHGCDIVSRPPRRLNAVSYSTMRVSSRHCSDIMTLRATNSAIANDVTAMNVRVGDQTTSTLAEVIAIGSRASVLPTKQIIWHHKNVRSAMRSAPASSTAWNCRREAANATITAIGTIVTTFSHGIDHSKVRTRSVVSIRTSRHKRTPARAPAVGDNRQ